MMFLGGKIRIRVAGIIIRDDKILLVAHRKKKDIYWLLPGGGVNFGEALEQALKREFSEELGISVETGEIALVCDSIDPAGSRHILNICFYCSLLSEEYRLGSDKRLYDFSFFSKEELKNIRIYPPISNHLFSIMNNEKRKIYSGRIWL